MNIDNKLMKYIFELSKIEYKDEYKESFKKDLNKIIEYMGMLKELDLDEVEPMSHCISSENILREDKVQESFFQDEILKNAPKRKDGFFVVPKTIE